MKKETGFDEEKLKALIARVMSPPDFSSIPEAEFDPVLFEPSRLFLDRPSKAPELLPRTYPSPPLCGTHPICIRVPVRLIRAYKEQARRTGRNYQTLMNDALKKVSDAFV